MMLPSKALAPKLLKFLTRKLGRLLVALVSVVSVDAVGDEGLGTAPRLSSVIHGHHFHLGASKYGQVLLTLDIWFHVVSIGPSTDCRLSSSISAGSQHHLPSLWVWCTAHEHIIQVCWLPGKLMATVVNESGRMVTYLAPTRRAVVWPSHDYFCFRKLMWILDQGFSKMTLVQKQVLFP